jgi:hypothetical protein
MYLPAIHDERTTLRNYLEVQLDAIRDAGYGLDDDQLRSTPLRSELSLAGLLKHATWCMAGALAASGRMDDPPLDLADFYGSFSLEHDRTSEQLRTAFEAVKPRYLSMIEETDLDAVMTAPPAPWYGIAGGSQIAMRYLVVHHVEEFARHAGHADIIREEIDGAQAASLNAAVEGREPNDFVKPWEPAMSTS